jgi:hypothetical protein
MGIAVVGGTGLAGRHTVDTHRRAGHDPVVVARSRGVDVVSGKGLDDPFRGIDGVVDVNAFQAPDGAATRDLFGAGTRNLLAAEQRAGAHRHVLLSIVGIDRLEGHAHMAGRRLQEEPATAGPVPFTIQRATHPVVKRTRQGQVDALPPLLVQPVADVGTVLAEVVTGPPRGRVPDLASAEPRTSSTWRGGRWRRAARPSGRSEPADGSLRGRRGRGRARAGPGRTARAHHARHLAARAEGAGGARRVTPASPRGPGGVPAEARRWRPDAGSSILPWDSSMRSQPRDGAP